MVFKAASFFKEVTQALGRDPKGRNSALPIASVSGRVELISSMKGDITNQLIPWGLLIMSQSQNEVWSRVKPVAGVVGRAKDDRDRLTTATATNPWVIRWISGLNKKSDLQEIGNPLCIWLFTTYQLLKSHDGWGSLKAEPPSSR